MQFSFCVILRVLISAGTNKKSNWIKMKDCSKKQDGTIYEDRGENQAIGGGFNQSASRNRNSSNNARGSALKPSLTKVKETDNDEIIVEPIYMILDKENNILICDYSTNRIILLDSELNFKKVLVRQQEEYQVEPSRIKKLSKQFPPPKIPEDGRAIDDYKGVESPPRKELPAQMLHQTSHSHSFQDAESRRKSRTPDTTKCSDDLKMAPTYRSFDKQTMQSFLPTMPDFGDMRMSKTKDANQGIDNVRTNQLPCKQPPVTGPKKASFPASKHFPRIPDDIKKTQPCPASKPDKRISTRESYQKSMKSCCDTINTKPSIDPQSNRNHCHDKLKAEWRKRSVTPAGISADNKSSNSRTIARQCCKCGKLIIKKGLLPCGEAKYPRADHPSECGLNSNCCSLGMNENKCKVECWPIGDDEMCINNNNNKSTKNSTTSSNKDKRSGKKKHHKSSSQSKHSSSSCKNQENVNKNYSAMLDGACAPCDDCGQVRPLEKDCHSPALCHYCSLHTCPSDYRKLCEANPEKDLEISGECYKKSCFQSKQAGCDGEAGSTKSDGLQMLSSAPIKLERPYRLCLDEEKKLLFVASSSIYNGNQLIVFKY